MIAEVEFYAFIFNYYVEVYILIGIMNVSNLTIDESIKIGIPFKEFNGIFRSPVHVLSTYPAPEWKNT